MTFLIIEASVTSFFLSILGDDIFRTLYIIHYTGDRSSRVSNYHFSQDRCTSIIVKYVSKWMVATSNIWHIKLMFTVFFSNTRLHYIWFFEPGQPFRSQFFMYLAPWTGLTSATRLTRSDLMLHKGWIYFY